MLGMSTSAARRMWAAVLLAAVWAIAGGARAQTVVFEQAADAAGGQYKSAWYDPDGLDDDAYVWDSFTLGANTAITQVRWRGAYTNYLSGAGKAPVYRFRVSIYASNVTGFEPDVTHPPLVKYTVEGNCGETPAGVAGGVAMYDYQYTLPSAFQAAAGVKYWLQIEASQGLTPVYSWPPDWSIAKGTGGNGTHFRKVGGTGGMFHSISGDCAFALLTAAGQAYSVTTAVLPAGAGTVAGAGSYPAGTNATVRATANHGYAFVNWTEGGSQVSGNPNYTFAVTRDRSLTAQFVEAYTVTTAADPTYGGTTSGGGVYPVGTPVTVVATAGAGFVFDAWTEFGAPVSTSATYTFDSDMDHALAARFVNAPGSATFDFDDAPVHTSLPVSVISNGIGAVLSAPTWGYSIQAAGTLGLTPAGFGGLCVYPNTVYRADLAVDFSETLTDFSIMYAVQELGCDDTATMRATAFLGGVEVATDTATAPVPGTWPTGTVSVSAPGGFDRVVVHYDHPPPTCQDYGVIFLADNMTVTLLCSPVQIGVQPADAQTCGTGGATFAAAAAGPGGHAYRWEIEDPGVAGGWAAMVEGDNVLTTGGSFWAAGAGADLVWIGPPSWAGAMQLGSESRVRCVVSNGCSELASDAAALRVCVADVNCDLTVDLVDFFEFLNCFDQSLTCGDVNGDWQVDLADFFAFFNAFDQSC
jgi:hypothetical protein